MVAVFEVLAELQAVEEARQKEQFQEQVREMHFSV